MAMAVEVRDSSDNPTTPSAVASTGSAAASRQIKPGPGRLYKVVVTVTGTGTGATLLYDNANNDTSGTVIGAVPANAAAGTIFDLQMPFKNGLVVGTGPANSAALTLSYS